jgi:hypothetical protein
VRIDPLKLPPRAALSEPHCRRKIRLSEARRLRGGPGRLRARARLQREADAEIVNHEAGKYARRDRR